MRERWGITVTGRVQGVGFRAACRRRARQLGLDGWVRNRPDGSVRIEAEGSVDRLTMLLQWAGQGPPAARVTAVEHQGLQPVDEEGFEVIR